jgi:hypothetical protein
LSFNLIAFVYDMRRVLSLVSYKLSNEVSEEVVCGSISGGSFDGVSEGAFDDVFDGAFDGVSDEAFDCISDGAFDGVSEAASDDVSNGTCVGATCAGFGIV